MNGRLKIIEQQLLGIDSAAFQNLCDIYLHMREKSLISVNRTGSQFGKQKTVKGTPDSFFRLADGSLRYVEYTTKAESLASKIKEDIDKCLDADKTGVPANEIQKIIICFNSRLNVDEETSITDYATSKNIRIELIGLDWLALEIYSKYLILAKDILGIALDTGQLLPLQNFVDEYNNKAGKLSTPLDNIFLHRKMELADIETILVNNDMLIISGFPGVGKTKIALEALSKFITRNEDYSAFAVSKKDIDISEDLKIHLQQEDNYILLVDDANRQLINFKQILGVFREQRKGNIKIVITVRDYALEDVKNECIDYKYQIINLSKFTDEEIEQLINSDTFGIKNPKYQKKIVEIADGNARLAIMASLLAKQEQLDFLHGDGIRIFELYDLYFKTFIRDYDVFANKSLLKTLGIISFFFTIDRKNKEFIETILNVFELDYFDFNEAIDVLEEKELIEVQYNHVRVSEQVMATYFFYKVFIKDELLSFKILLFVFFQNWKKRFSDTIIPSNNTFGYENVFKKINNTLDEYLYSIYSEEKNVKDFFLIFWFYKGEELLNYYHSKIESLPEPQNSDYNTHYETNDFVWDRDETLDYLSNLYSHFTQNFLPSLELSFEYCRKNPEYLPELIRRIREKLLFDDDDYHYGFVRQVDLFKLLISNLKQNQPHYVKAFFALSKTFLSHYFHITKGGRNNSIMFYDYPLPFNEITKQFRQNIWTTLFENFDTYHTEVFEIISHYRPGDYKEAILEILEFDLSLLIPFINQYVEPDSFKVVYGMNIFIDWLDKQNLTDKSYHDFRGKFKSNEYTLFRKLDWNQRRGKADYEFEDYDEFRKLKEKDIRESFIFQNENDFALLHTVVNNGLLIGGNYSWGIYESLDIIVEENFIKNEELGFDLIKSIINNYPQGQYPLYKSIKIITRKSEKWALKLWKLIKEWNHEQKLNWELTFLENLPSEFSNDYYKKELLKTIKDIDKTCQLRFENFEKFLVLESDSLANKILSFLSKIDFIKKTFKLKENIVEEILEIVYKKNENPNIRILLPHNFFEKYSPMLTMNFRLLKKSYLQQAKKDTHMDYNHSGFKELILIDPNFLIEYIECFYTEKNGLNVDTYRQLSFVWDLNLPAQIIIQSINIIIANNYYLGLGNHPIIIFFNHLTNDQEIKAKVFLLEFIAKSNMNAKKMNAIFGMLRNVLHDFYMEALLNYLTLNKDVKNFEKIWWVGNGGTYSGDEIIGEIKAKEWQNVLEIVGKSKNQLELIPIKNYIKKQIESELKSAERERMRNFTNPKGF